MSKFENHGREFVKKNEEEKERRIQRMVQMRENFNAWGQASSH